MRHEKAVLILTALVLGSVAIAGDSLKPVLIGIYSQDHEETIAWYVGNLGFVVTNEFENEAGNIRLAFLDNGEFELEIYSDLIPDRNAERISRDRFGMPGEGFVKLSLEAEALPPLEARLRSNGVNFVRDINESDRKPGYSWFMISDPDGNLIQVFGPTP